MFSFFKRRRWLFGLFLALSLIVGEFWLYAANRLADALHEKVFDGASFADFCASSDIAGFPFRLRLSCAQFSAPLRTAGGAIIVKFDQANGVASLFSPNHVVLTLSSPVTLVKADGAALAKLRHDGMTLDLAWTTSGLNKVSLDVVALDWRPAAPAAGIPFNLQKLTAQANIVTAASGDALRFDATGDGLTAPLLQAALPTSEPGHLSLGGAIVPAPGMAEDWRAAVEIWRRNAGAVAIDKFEWRAGATSLALDGSLTLDDMRRPTGQLKLVATGAGPLLAQFGIPAGVTQAQILIGALLGKPGAKTANGDGDAIALPLTLAQGHIAIGPLRLRDALAPLY